MWSFPDVPACLVCGADVTSDSRLYQSLLRCARCGFIFADLPDPVELSPLYQEEYFHGGEYDDYVRDRPMLAANFADRIGALRRFSPGGALFEIGAAYGFFLELARSHWQVTGIDISEPAVRYARHELGLDVVCGEFLEQPLTDMRYDVFCMWDTIEHLERPDDYLDRIARHLRPGGLLALTTGDVGSAVARLQGQRWRLIHPPTHLWYFSRESITRLLDRYGFDVVYFSHPGNYRSISALSRWSLEPLGANGRALHARLAQSAWGARGINLNLFDIMYVIARRR